MLRSLLDFLDYVPGVGLALWLVNFSSQRLFGLDRTCRFPKHFTSRVLHSTSIIIESNCNDVRRSFAVSGGCYINGADGISIGKGTIFAPNVAIVSQTHDMYDLNQAPPTTGIRIGRNCWIGFGVFINPGVTIGDNTIIGANSVVTTSFPCGHCVLVGAPARIVKTL